MSGKLDHLPRGVRDQILRMYPDGNLPELSEEQRKAIVPAKPLDGPINTASFRQARSADRKENK